MSASSEVFVDADLPLAEFVRELEAILSIKLELFTRDFDTWFDTWYEHLDPNNIRVTINEHEFVNDRDMNFEDYRFEISVWGFNDWDPEDRKQKRLRYARFIFDKLKTADRYPIMLVDDLNMLLDRYSPRAE